MKSIITLLIFPLLLLTFAKAQPPTAENILKDAYKRASEENKKVFVIFHASWCGWCHKMDNSINDPSCKIFFDKNYVITHLVVKESKGKEQLENPGAEELLKKYKGDKTGIPFWIILDSKGELLADSQIRPEGAGLDSPGDNSGCPASENEVAYFIKVLRKTSSINEKQLSVIKERFRLNESR